MKIKKVLVCAIALATMTACGNETEKLKADDNSQSVEQVEEDNKESKEVKENKEDSKESKEEKTSSENKKEESKKEEKSNKLGFDGTHLTANDLDTEITDYKVIQPEEDGNEYGEKPVIAFWYKTTNKSDKDIDSVTAWAVMFKAIQDNDPNKINELELGGHPDSELLDGQFDTIKQGGIVENAVSYVLTDEETPVTLKATAGIAGEDLGQFDYELK